jgi:pilus assembly protein Flp/PilA
MRIIDGKGEAMAMSHIIEHFVKDESGATVVEYAILVASIAMAVVVIVGVLGSKLDATFQGLVSKMKS